MTGPGWVYVIGMALYLLLLMPIGLMVYSVRKMARDQRKRDSDA